MYKHKAHTWFRRTVAILFFILVIGFLLPQLLRMPVDHATIHSYSQNSFWAYPWGESVTHKGVDIFAKKGTAVHAATYGLVIFKGKIKRGGNAVMVLGPKWRIHYYAHLDTINTNLLSVVSSDSEIGTVGNTGNAAGKPPHLHYTIKSIIPYPWRLDNTRQGWKKMFYLDPIPYLNKSSSN